MELEWNGIGMELEWSDQLMTQKDQLEIFYNSPSQRVILAIVSLLNVMVKWFERLLPIVFVCVCVAVFEPVVVQTVAESNKLLTCKLVTCRFSASSSALL